MKKLLLMFSLLALLLALGCEVPDDDTPYEPATDITVTGPVTGGSQGMPWMTAWEDLDARGYVEEEFFFEGDAGFYAVDGRIKANGKWDMVKVDSMPYKSRLLVRRPRNPEDFNGTVVVEWFNVSGMVDSGPGWMFNEPLLTREGCIWVGVDAQKQGVDGTSVANVLQPLTAWDPERYGSLHHPGDNYAYDIYTQAAQVIRGQGSMGVLGGMTAKRVIAYGESQSAMTMTTYTNAMQPMAKAFDGMFIHSRASMSTPLATEDATFLDTLGSFAVKIRTDINVPVMQFQTETDVMGYLPSRQPDTDMIRTWEVPGTAHADYYLASCIMNPEIPENVPFGAGAFYCEAGNRGPQYIVLRAALKGLDLWIKDGIAPPEADRITTQDSTIVRDEFGNALGGIRTPHVDVPIATYTTSPSFGQDEDFKLIDMVCAIFGGTEWFTEEQLLSLYPTHEDYVEKYTASVEATVAAGFMLEEEAAAILDEANAAAIPH